MQCIRRYDQKCAKDNAEPDQVNEPKLLRSSTPSFNWKLHCFFRSELCHIDPKCKDSKKKTMRVATLVIRESVLEPCSKRGDEWGLDVHSRLMTCNDLVAEEAVYHTICHVNFFRVNK